MKSRINGKLTQWLDSSRRGYVDLPDGRKVLVKQENFTPPLSEIQQGMLLSFEVEMVGAVVTAVNVRPYGVGDLSLCAEDMLMERLGVFGEIIAWDPKSRSGTVWVDSCQTEVAFDREAWQSASAPRLNQRVLIKAEKQQEQWQAQWLRDPEQAIVEKKSPSYILYALIFVSALILSALVYYWFK